MTWVWLVLLTVLLSACTTAENLADKCPEICPQPVQRVPGWCLPESIIPGEVDECGCIQAPTCTDSCAGLPLGEAIAVAKSSPCSEELTVVEEEYFCNENSGTWWIELVPDENGCNPACVVDSAKTAQINWRCTGANP